jgi:hypothetical protein
MRHLLSAPMLRRLSLGLMASAISVACLSDIAQEDGSADGLRVISISLRPSSQLLVLKRTV